MSPMLSLIARVEKWIASIDRDRDEIAQRLNYEAMSPIERAFLTGRLDELERRRAGAVASRALCEHLRQQPETVADPPKKRMLRAPLRRQPERKRA